MHNVCSECGGLANYVTCMAKYGHPPKKDKREIMTFSVGRCEYCGRVTYVTEERDFFYPNFELINWKKYRECLRKRGDKVALTITPKEANR